MKNFVFILLLTILSIKTFTLHAQIKGNYPTGEKKFSIDTLNGMYNGKCIKWFENGTKAYEGSYKNNQKIGLCIVWDSLQQIRMQCRYMNNMTFESLVLTNSEGISMRRRTNTDFINQRTKDSLEIARVHYYYNVSNFNLDSVMLKQTEPLTRQLFGYENYIQKRNNYGLIEYPQVADRDIIFGTVIYSFVLSEKANILIFKNDNLLNCIKKYLKKPQQDYNIYTTNEFVKKITPEEVLPKLNTKKTIVGYKIKEYYYFDSKLLSSTTRIMGICPVKFNKQTQKYEDLFWIYYPALREQLADIKLKIEDAPEIETFEDILHFKHFSSLAYFREHVIDKEEDFDIYKNLKILKTKSAEIDGLLLSFEHNIWLYLTR